jgi:HEAT repeat protein
MLLQRAIFPYISKLDEEPLAPYRDAEVRTVAVHLTGSINLQTLTWALNGDDSNIKLLALAELSQMGEEAVPVIMKALNDENSQVRRYAVTLLSKAVDERAVNAVSKRLKDSDARVRLAATVALGRMRSNTSTKWTTPTSP